VRAFKPFERLGGIRPRLQVSAAVGSATAGRAKDLAIPHCRSSHCNCRSQSRDCEIRSEESIAANSSRKTEDGTILGKNGAFRLDYNTRHGEDTNEDERTNYIPWRLMELLTRLYEVHMDSVLLATRPTLDKTLLSWSAFSAGFFLAATSTILPGQ
jgi:recombinational DNA repair protein RecR